MKGRVQWSKYGDQYADLTNGFSNQLSGGAQALPSGIFGAEGALLKMPNVTSRDQATLLHQSYLDKQQ